MVPFHPSIPNVGKKTPAREYRLGNLLARLYRDAEPLNKELSHKEAAYKYPFVLWVVDPDKRDDRLIVTSEITPPAFKLPDQDGSPFLCAFIEGGSRVNLGSSPDWNDLDKFSAGALAFCKSHLKIDAEPELIFQSPPPKKLNRTVKVLVFVVGLTLGLAGISYLKDRDKKSADPLPVEEATSKNSGFTPVDASEASKSEPKDLGQSPEDALVRTILSRETLKGVEEGDPKAQFKASIGYALSNKPKESERLLASSAAGGYLPAMIELGKRYVTADDIKNAKAWFEKAASAGDPEGNFELSKLLDKSALATDKKQAQELLQQTAEQGWPDAQALLGSKYLLGVGFKKDIQQANIWLKRGADNGALGAQAHLCSNYVAGKGVPRNYKTAAEWCTKAAAQGSYIAMSQLGALYEQGLGVAMDLKSAYALYNETLESQDPYIQQMAQKDLDRISEKMSPQQINEAQSKSASVFEGNRKGEIFLEEIDKSSKAKKLAREGVTADGKN
jgi:uncharacterized protein